jgi:hypothetical protein
MRLRGYRSDDNLFWRESVRGPRKSFRLRSDFERGFPPLGGSQCRTFVLSSR